MPPTVTAIFLLTLSNVFMTFAWYAHLRHVKSWPWLYAVYFMFRS